MSITLAEVAKHLEAQGLVYFADSGKSAAMLGLRGEHGAYQIVVSVQAGGTFLQLRTLAYLECPADHPARSEVMSVLVAVNDRSRLVKFGWSPLDGMITGYADLWVMDATVTEKQFRRMFENFLPVVDESYRRLSTAIETGQDPGPLDPTEPLRSSGAVSDGDPVATEAEPQNGEKPPPEIEEI